ncbi:MAG TPA: efflux RND transporter periplasmic adaptor subunit [Verrucomicrobiae bacterium]
MWTAIAAGLFLLAFRGGAADPKPADVDYYTCTMHPSVKLQDPKAKCPICGMNLAAVKKKAAAAMPEAPSKSAAPAERKRETGAAGSKPADVDYYTCTMHPSVRSQDPKGKCPICGMDLVPVKKKSAAAPTPEAPSEFTVPVERQQQIGVTWAVVEKRQFHFAIRAFGAVAADRQRRWNYVPRVAGYIEKLFVFSPGELVDSNAPLMEIYSPELFTAEKEFVNALRMPKGLNSSDDLVDAARERLRLWNVTGEQIDALEKSLKPEEYLTLRSPFRGIVENIGPEQGSAVAAGDRVAELVDLSSVWVWAQFYQDDLPLLKKGLPAAVTISGEAFEGKISAIDPFINDATRTARVRIDVENPNLKLRPGMYVDVNVTGNLGEGLAVPVSAVLPTGLRNIVFVDKGEGRLEPRSIETGRQDGEFFEVKSGLKENERVAASANFLIDAEAQVQGALKQW